MSQITPILETVPGIEVADENIDQGAAIRLNFTGAGVSAAVVGTNATITIPGGGSSGITTQDEGVDQGTGQTILNFAGAGVSAVAAGSTTTITIPGSAGGLTIPQTMAIASLRP